MLHWAAHDLKYGFVYGGQPAKNNFNAKSNFHFSSPQQFLTKAFEFLLFKVFRKVVCHFCTTNSS